ncbi:CD99 antigen-like isoform X2 [Pan troglodytes]|nr:CD99 antigen-like [Pan troglodytes]XP_024209074.1 CD99 antigen-like [Pan troglodytes]XP_024209075.1 CD99 antigen-like [Pan troglodytes]XP_054533255.1 CD99 antigen-like [Pan troglodytes]XP_054533256.1 CD99 antigen-like [Pan troglodytes]XP_054533257.1 CD99 antigen-like [Pan troglodytes]
MINGTCLHSGNLGNDRAPPNSPKLKPNANPEQPGFIGDDFDLADALHDKGNYEPAPLNPPKPKPNPNPKQPDSTGDDFDFTDVSSW